MSLEKAIKHKKEKRKPYYDSRRFDRTCRCNGSCGYCRGNRLYSYHRNVAKCNQEIDEWMYDEDESDFL